MHPSIADLYVRSKQNDLRRQERKIAWRMAYARLEEAEAEKTVPPAKEIPGVIAWLRGGWRSA